MALIENPASPLVSRLEGFHLFGFDAAPCSQRVSFALAEKGLLRGRRVKYLADSPRDLVAAEGTYTFRHVSLIRHDNLTAEYAAIQPNMVVPALVHDGRLHIESMEIIRYLDEVRSGSRLLPDDPERATLCAELIERGKTLHVSVRHVTFHWSLGKLGKTNKAIQDRARELEQEGSPEQLADFYRQFNDDAIAVETFVHHLNELEAGYAEQNARLEADGRPFLTGDTFTAADIIWAIKVLRLTECGYPFGQHFPALSAWFSRVEQRPGYQDGVMDNHRFFHHAFRFKSRLEHWFGGGISRASRIAA